MALQSTTALATVTLQEASSTVTFSGIPDTYRDLVLVSKAGGSGQWVLNLNGDSSTSNYLYVAMRGRSAGAGGYSFTTDGAFYDGMTLQSTLDYINICEIIDYSQTNKHKTLLFRGNSASASVVTATAARYASNNAITSLTVSAVGGSFLANSTFALFGRVA
jgi:hypothetical protein